MNKSFYVVVPYSLIESERKKGAKAALRSMFKKKETLEVQSQSFHQAKAQLWQRVDHIASSLSGMGVRALPLNTEELIELFYSLYNPGLEKKRNLGSLEEMGIGE